MTPRQPGRPGAPPLLGASLLAAAANVVMQLSRPEVGYGVVESTVTSGQLFRHPLRRTRTTLAYLAVALAGSGAERQAYREAVNAVHAHVRSGPDSPVAYDARDPELQRWVAACLYRGLEDTVETFIGPLDATGREALYAGSAGLATTLQVPLSLWPADRTAFERTWQSGLSQVAVDATIRSYLDDVVTLRFLPHPLAAVLGPAHRFVTAGFLGEPFRAELGLVWDQRRQRRFERLITGIALLVRHAPPVVREFPFNVVLWDVRRRLRVGRPLLR